MMDEQQEFEIPEDGWIGIQINDGIIKSQRVNGGDDVSLVWQGCE